MTSHSTHRVAQSIACLVAIAALSIPAAAGPPETGTIIHRIDVGTYQILEEGGSHRVMLEGFGWIGEAGRPQLPGKVFAVAIPPGAGVTAVAVEADEPIRLPGSYRVRPHPMARVIGHEPSAVYRQMQNAWQEARDAAYSSDDTYPARPGWLVREAGYRAYNLIDVRVAPFRYRPESGRLEYFPSLTIRIDYSLPESPEPVARDRLTRSERTARQIICNYEQAQAWYIDSPAPDRDQTHDFVIITRDGLEDAVAPLVVHERNKGRTPVVITVQWIDATYPGWDRAARIRAFLRDTYLSWGIQDVLLMGSRDWVPMRECWVDLGYGRPQTDFYYAELSEPDELSWDLNGDRHFGEDGVDVVDMYSEVNVGRVPWDTAPVVRHICTKSVDYELDDDPAYKKNILAAGSFFWDDTDTAVLMEATLDQPWMIDWTATRMYEDNADYTSSYPSDYPLNHTNFSNAWSTGSYAFVNWAGHGSPVSAHILGESAPAFIETADCVVLDDEHPAIVWSDSCSTANPAYANLAREMLRRGAVGFVGATAVAGGAAAWQGPEDGSSQSCDYWFTVKVTSGEMTQGEAHQWALRKLYTDGLWGWPSYEVFEWTLHGSPGLALRAVSYPGAIFMDGFESGHASTWARDST